MEVSMCMELQHLHSNMFLLIPADVRLVEPDHLDLHSNMFLLIRELDDEVFKQYENLHSNMFLLILNLSSPLILMTSYLHSNMFLLIPTDGVPYDIFVKKFTFQYVSINTASQMLDLAPHHHLHSNMFLLIPLPPLQSNPVCIYLHSNMFLLILALLIVAIFLELFTFQYVSINT